MNNTAKAGIYSIGLYVLFLCIFSLGVFNSVTAKAAGRDTTSISPISKILLDKNGDGKADLIGQNVRISGRASVASSVFDDEYLMVYVQDRTGGILVFSDTLKHQIGLGDSLVVSGKLQLYSGKPEVMVESYSIIETKEKRVPNPISLDKAFEEPQKYSGMLAEGKAIVTQKNFGNTMAMLRISPIDSSDHSLYAFVSRSNTNYSDFDFDILSVGDHIRIKGIVEKYNSDYFNKTIYEVLPRTPEDIKYSGLPQQYRNVGLAVGWAILIIVGGWVMLLKKQVKARTNELTQALEERDTLMREMHHRVKNNLAVIASILELQKFQPVESVDELIEDTQARIQSIAKIHEKLYQTETLTDIEVREYIEEFSDVLFKTFNSSQKDIRLRRDIEPFRLDIEKAVPLGLIINELLSNAYKHGFPDIHEGDIKITLTKEKDTATISVADNGKGLPANFSITNGESLGTTLIQTLTDQLEGKIEVNQNGWTEFKISFPVSD